MNGDKLTTGFQPYEEEILDGKDTWWSEYQKEEDMDNKRLSLNDNLQHKWFVESMDVLREHKLSLKPYDAEIFQKLEDGYSMAGRTMTVTRKQMEHIKQVAFDLAKGC